MYYIECYIHRLEKGMQPKIFEESSEEEEEEETADERGNKYIVNNKS